MSDSYQLALIPSMAAIAFTLGAPDSIVAQTVGVRAASVSLTVVVPPRSNDATGIAIENGARITGRSATTMDLENIVGLADRSVSRVEVRRGTGWSAMSPRVWVRNRHGEFEPLDSEGSVVALETPFAFGRAESAVQFRVATSRGEGSRIDMPIEYRVTVGEGDHITIWQFTSTIRADSLPDL